MGKLKIPVKDGEELAKMIEGGKRLGRVKVALKKEVKIGVTAEAIEEIANSLIKKMGGKPSFKEVPGYHWATCININNGVVHGIPEGITFKKGDIVSVDVGMLYQGYHTDTSFTVGLGIDRETRKFLEVGRDALKKAIDTIIAGKRIYDISEMIEKTIEADGYTPVEDLVGHGVGKKLHEDPAIPCFTLGARQDSPAIPEGAVLAIEVMYTRGKKDLVIGRDGWTITTRDGKIAALFEETVAVTGTGPLILTGG